MEPAKTLDPQPLPPAPAPQPQAAPVPMRKRPLLAAALAFFPGLGNIYNGLYLRGVIFFAAVAALMSLARGEESGNTGFVIAFVWLFNVIDSFRQAQLINLGIAQDLGMEDLPKLPKAGQGGLFAGLLLIALGALASLQLFFGIEMSWILRYWPLGLLALGLWLVVAHVRERAREKSADGDAL